MKIDADSNGTIDWDEFTNFMLLENQAASDMSDRSYSERLQETGGPVEPNPKHLHHRDMMDGILQVPKLDRLFTHSRDGTVRVERADSRPPEDPQGLRRVGDRHVPLCLVGPRCRLDDGPLDLILRHRQARASWAAHRSRHVAALPRLLERPAPGAMIVGDDQGGITLYDTVPRSSGETYQCRRRAIGAAASRGGTATG